MWDILIPKAKLHADADVRSLQDAIWLAHCMEITPPSQAEPDQPLLTGPSLPPLSEQAKENSKQNPPENSFPQHNDPAEEPLGPGLPKSAIQERMPSSQQWIGALPSLPDKAEFRRALKPFSNQPAQFAGEFDELETIELYAVNGGHFLVPVLRKGPRRRVSVCLLVEEIGSNAIWAQPLHELEEILRLRGVFREVTRKTFCEHAQAYQWCRDEILIVASDFTSANWRNDIYPQLLQRWAKTQPILLMHTLPERLWTRTWTGKPDAWASATQAVQATQSLKIRLASPIFSKPNSKFAFPLGAVDALSLANWAKVCMHTGTSQMPAIVHANRIVRKAPTTQIANRSAEQKIEAYFNAVSPLSRKLALLFAVTAPLNFPLMRWVQQAMLPESDSSHLAEFFLSGLLQRVAGDANTPTDEVLYDFIDGVRDLLQLRLPISQGKEVMQMVGAYLEAHYSDEFDLSAMVQRPQEIEKETTPIELQAFAMVSHRFLQRIGLLKKEERVDIGETKTKPSSRNKEKKISWLHIADVYRLNTQKLKELCDYLEEKFNNTEFSRPDFIFCTGDLISGTGGGKSLEQQYKKTWDFVMHLAIACKVDVKNIFVVPGNRDVNRSVINERMENSVINASISQTEEIWQRQKINERDYFKPLTEYNKFIQEKLPHQASEGERNFYASIISVNGLKIGIAGFNSAWLAFRDNKGRLMIAAESQFNFMKYSLAGKTDICIGLMHHPINWLIDQEKYTAKKYIRNEFQFWLHGHNHDTLVEKSGGNISIYSGLISPNHFSENRFNLVCLDVEKGTGVVNFFDGDSRDGKWINARDEKDFYIDFKTFIKQENIHKRNFAADNFLQFVRAIFIGDGDAGKTSIIRALHNESLVDEKKIMTSRIDIRDWSGSNINTRAKIWDFGGLVTAYGAHPIFLRPSCLYVLVLSPRADIDLNDSAEYWLQQLNIYGANPPVMIVVNEQRKTTLQIDMISLKDKFPNIVGFYTLPSVQVHRASQMQVFKEDFSQQLQVLASQQVSLSMRYALLIEEISKLSVKDNFLSFKEFYYLGKMCGFGNDEIMNRSLIFDALDKFGIIVDFKYISYLDEVLINPQWLAHGVCAILHAGKAYLSEKYIIKILSNTEGFDEIKRELLYPPSKCKFLINVMKKFKICYELKHENALIIPSLFPLNFPKINFEKNDATYFEFYFFEFIPNYIFHEFVVIRYSDIENGMVWQCGVKLYSLKLNSSALVQVNYKNRNISIFVNGGQARDYLEILRCEILAILWRMAIKFTEFIELPRKTLISNGKLQEAVQEKVNYRQLIDHARAGHRKFISESGNVYDISMILDGVLNEKESVRLIGELCKELGNLYVSMYSNGFKKDGDILREIYRDIVESAKTPIYKQAIRNGINALQKIAPEIGNVISPILEISKKISILSNL